MRSSEGNRGTHGGGLAAGAVLVLVGAGLAVLPWTSPDLRPRAGTTTALGVAVLGVGLGLLLSVVGGSPGKAAVLVGQGEASALRVRLRAQLPLAMVAIGGGFAVAGSYGVLATGLNDGGLLLLPVVALLASVVPDAVRALMRRAHVLVTSERIVFHGWGVDASLAWDDIVGAELTGEGTRRPMVTIAGRPGAVSWTCRRSRIIWPLDQEPPAPQLDVLLTALDAPGRLLVLVNDLVGRTVDERRAMIGTDARAFLTGEMTR